MGHRPDGRAVRPLLSNALARGAFDPGFPGKTARSAPYNGTIASS